MSRAHSLSIGRLGPFHDGPELVAIVGDLRARGLVSEDDPALGRFRDSEALIEHAAHLGDLSAAILAIVSVVHGEILGEPSAELRAKLAGSEVPVLFTPYQSM